MENAVDALKIAFAVLVFVIAITLAFQVVGQARNTSDIVFGLNDKSDMEYTTALDHNATEDRIVGFETILPTICRYFKEQYAVTIVDTKGIPIVRFDLYTENIMGNWNEILKKTENGTKAIETTEEGRTYIEVNERLTDVQNAINAKLKSGEQRITLSAASLNKLYAVERDNKTKVNNVWINEAPWMGDTETEIEKRIQADIMGTFYNKNKTTYVGKNLNLYKKKKFKEMFVEVQTSGTTIEEDGYSLETVKGNYKLEIVYIMQ